MSRVREMGRRGKMALVGCMLVAGCYNTHDVLTNEDPDPPVDASAECAEYRYTQPNDAGIHVEVDAAMFGNPVLDDAGCPIPYRFYD